jgi:hypothetical protein
MNERIQELAEQAEIYAGELIDEGADYDQYPRYYTEKFAELIVQECIDIIAPYTVRMNRPGEEYLHPILEIKQHFGVEE